MHFASRFEKQYLFRKSRYHQKIVTENDKAKVEQHRRWNVVPTVIYEHV